MKFHAAILNFDGGVTASERRDGDVLGRNDIGRKMMADFKLRLREKLTDDPLRCGKFMAEFCDRRHIMEWQQVDPLSAMARFYVDHRLVAACFFLHGFVPEMDEAALDAAEALLTGWLGGPDAGRAACQRLRSTTERPVVVVLPGTKKLLRPADWRTIGNLCPCLAAVFLERANQAIENISGFWSRQGFVAGQSADGHRWN